MKESLKFGPEWLRNTVAPAIELHTTSSGAPATRHPLAEFRYGREEMLALFDKSCKLPDMGNKHKKLFVEKIQSPLALTPVTDEEVEYTRSSSWAARPPLGGIAPGGRGRGGSADRGRGRGRGFFSSTGYQRSTSLYDEEGRSLGRGERSWNGTGEPGTTEWSGAGAGITTSPRKEYIRPGGVESWRRRGDDENPVNDWRSSGYNARDKWSTRSWRDEEGGTNPNSEYPPHGISRSYSNPSGSNGIERKPYSAAGGVTPGKKKAWGDHDDSLPEWATEDPSDYGGSFDATGAFHDSEDDDPRKPKPRMRSNSVSEREDEVVPEKKERESSEEGGTSSSSSISGSPSGVQEPIQNPIEPVQEPEASDDSGTHVEEQRNEILVHRDRIHLISDSSVDRMQEVADDMVAQLIMEDEMNVLEAHGPIVMGKASPLLSAMAVKDARPRPASTAEFWFYQDPHQKVQGPFSAQEMADWYVAGYFDATLLVRRSCDSRFSTLGDLLKICGGTVPFMASHLIPPMNVSPELPPQHQLLTVLPTPAPNLDNEIQLRYQLQNLQKSFLVQKQQLILQKLAATDTWSRLTVDQQNALLSHHMGQVQMPDHLQSINTMTSLSPQQIALLQQQEGVALGTGAVKLPMMQQQQPPQQNHHNVPSNLQSQQQHAKNFMQQQQAQQQLHRQMAPVTANNAAVNAAVPNPLSQMMQQMSLSHLIAAPQNATSHPSPVPHQQVLSAAAQVQQSQSGKTPSPMHDNDPIQSLIMQLKIQNGNQMPGIPHQPAPKHNQMADSLLANMWSGSNQGTSLQQLLQGGAGGVGNQFVGPPRVMMDEAIRRQHQMEHQMEQQQQQQQQQQQEMGGWKSANTNPLLSMWDMPPNAGAGMGQNFDKTDHIVEDSMKEMRPQEELMNESVNENDARAENKVEHELKQHKQEHPPKNERKQPKRDEEQPKNNNKKNDTKKGGQNKKEADEKRRDVEKQQQQQQQRSKEQANKKRQIEEEKARKQAEETKRKIADEKRRLDEMNEQQRKSKILEAQRRETVKIQEMHSRQPTTMAPWSTAGVPTGPSLIEIEKLERQQRAEQMRQEHAIREQQEHQQMLQLQQQKENILKWNASVKPQAVKSLAEIQAEEQSKQSAVEREMAERQAAKHREKKELDTITGASFWAQSMPASSGGSAWNTAKIWGPNNATSNPPSSNSTSGGGFWEEPTGKVSSSGSGGGGGNGQKSSASKTLAKSQTMGSITTNKSSAEKLQSKATNKSTSNVNAGTSSGGGGGGGSGQKRSGHKERVKDDVNYEFTNWCSKSLNNLKANVDVPTFITFLQDIESPYEVKDYIRLYLGETKECSEFSKQFLERRSKLRNHQRAQNAHIDDMCSPAPALTPFNDFQEVKNKSKKIKKSKMTKVDNRILGFSVTAAPEHWNLEKNLDNSSS